uniref:HA domain-containing protein n=1 Tax=Macrostomum lignano TaxID=282301 RepID=A0A1I8IB58_9PLAT
QFDTLLAEVTDIADRAPAASENGGEAGDLATRVRARMQDQFQRVTASLGLEATSERVAQLPPARSQRITRRRELSLGTVCFGRISNGWKDYRLDELRQLLQDKWKQAEAGLLVDGRLGDYRRSVLELGDWLDRWSKEVAREWTLFNCKSTNGRGCQRENADTDFADWAALPPSGVGGEPHEAAQLADELEAKLKNFNERIKLTSEQLIRICAFFGGCAE